MLVVSRFSRARYTWLMLVLAALLGARVRGADGFASWDKTQAWAKWCVIRGLHWADGYGWWAVGVGDVAEDGAEFQDQRGLVLRSATGASGWSGNLLEWEVFYAWDPETPVTEHGSPQLGAAHTGSTLVTVGPDGVYAWNMNDNSFVQGSEGEVEDWNGDMVPNTFFIWGGGVAYGSGRFAATDTFSLDGNSPTIHTSAGGSEWADAGFTSPATPGNYWDDWGEAWGGTPGFPVHFGHGRFVAVTSYGWIITSTDGTTWQTVRQPRSYHRCLRGVAEKDGVFVAVGDGGTILRSTNGTSWHTCTSPTALDLCSVAAGNAGSWPWEPTRPSPSAQTA